MSDVESGLNFNRSDKHVGNRVVSGAALLWLTTMLLRVLQLASTAILARILTPADYGIVALATTIIGFLDLMSNLQVGGAIMRSRDLTRDHLDTAFTLNFLRGCLTATLLALLAHPLAMYMKEPRLEYVLYALMLSAIFGGIHNSHFLIYARNIDFRRDSKRNALAALTGSIVGIVAAFALRSYWALVIGSIATAFMGMCFSYFSVPGRPRFCLKKAGEFLSFGKWQILIAMLDYANNKVDYFLIGRGLGSKVLGGYHVGQQVTSMATGDVMRPLSSALLPAFSVLSENLERLRASYRQLQSITLAIALPIGFGVSVLANEIVLLLVGKQWALAVPVIMFLAPLGALQTASASVEALALSMNQGNKLFWRTAVFFVVRLSLMVTGYWLGGFMGIIYARVCSGSFFFLYGLGLAASITQGKMFDPILASWRSLVSVAVMWTVLFFLPTIPLNTLATHELMALLAGKIALGGVLYMGTHYLLWRLAGCPAGAERRLMDQGTRLFGKLRGRLGV